jgi:hypothetical protein
VEAVEGLARTHSQKFLLPPIQELAKPLVGRHNLEAIIQDDRRGRKCVQKFLEMRSFQDALVFRGDLGDASRFRRGKAGWKWI